MESQLAEQIQLLVDIMQRLENKMQHLEIRVEAIEYEMKCKLLPMYLNLKGVSRVS